MKKIFLYVMIALMPAMVTVSESAATKYTLNADPFLILPFFDGGLRIAECKEAEAKDRHTRLAYDDLKKNGEIKLRASWFGLKTLKASLKFLEDRQIFPSRPETIRKRSGDKS
jgi:outer membrane protein TolC